MTDFTIKSSCRISVLIFTIFVQGLVWGQTSASSSCGGVLELSSGVLDLDFSPADQNGQDFCMWVIKLPVSSQNIQFQLTQIPQSSQLNLYSQEGHVAGQFSILPIVTLTSANALNNTINIKESNLIAIWTPFRVQNENEKEDGNGNGGLLSFKWDSVKIQPGNEGRDLDLVGGVNYIEADRGRFSWVKPGESQQTLLWMLNSKTSEPLDLKIETDFEKCALVDPCLCSYFGVYEVYDNFLRVVSTECGRSSNVQVSGVQRHLVALGFVNPEFRRDTNHVTLSWKNEEPEEGATSTTTTEAPKACAPGFPKSCSEIQSETGLNSTELQSCTIYPDGPAGSALEVLCDFGTQGGGWTVFQKRLGGPRDDEDPDFDRLWDDYANGFGSLSGNFWLGLDNIHALTKNGDQELRVELEDFEGNKAYSKYSVFSVSGASDFYRLTVAGYSTNSSAGDSMTYFNFSNNNMRFTTKDKDNDDAGAINCAKIFPGGWWFSFCGYSSLNGLYWADGKPSPTWNGIVWNSWTGYEISLAKTEMKIRPRKST